MSTRAKPAPKEHAAVAAIRKSGAQRIKVAVSDIDGILRGKYLHRDKFLGVVEPLPKGGFGFCDVVLGDVYLMRLEPLTSEAKVQLPPHAQAAALDERAQKRKRALFAARRDRATRRCALTTSAAAPWPLRLASPAVLRSSRRSSCSV